MEPFSNTVNLSKGQQSVLYTELLKYGTHRLRIRIKSDSYAFQSFACIERWDGTQWQPAADIHYGSMDTPTGLHYTYDKADIDQLRPEFKVDRDTLLRDAMWVLDK